MPRDRSDNPVSLHVSGFKENTRPSDLAALFEPHGRIDDIYILIDYYTGHPRGFAYIQYHNEDDARRIYESGETFTLDGRRLDLQYAQGKRKTPNQMRGQGRGRRSRSPDRYRPRRYSRSRSPGRRDRRRGRSRSRSPQRRRSPSPRRRSPSPRRRRSPSPRRRSRSRSARGRSPSREQRSGSRSHSRSNSPRRNNNNNNNNNDDDRGRYTPSPKIYSGGHTGVPDVPVSASTSNAGGQPSVAGESTEQGELVDY
ncbi:MAG: hypothetical protein J3Q66DRAFT_336190 [Benniella sp.]|nr:MAG: hypothetical protein J3Q66DRAFT_336190 [Benniella sp.]